MIKIAILIPAYNVAATIKETLDSIQSNLKGFSNVNHIYIADDCSTDNTVSICKQRSDSSNISIIRADSNVGERANINRAVSKLNNKYDWLLLIHADDLAKKEWLNEMCVAIFNSTEDTASISSSYDVIKEDGSIEPGENREETIKILGNLDSVRDTLIKGTWWHISGCAIKISALNNSGGFHNDLPQYGDMEWLLRIMGMGYSIDYIPKSLTKYRQLSSSISSKSFKIHRDLFERANLIIAYKNLLGFYQVFKFYISLIYTLIRRIVKSIASLNFRRIKYAIALIFKLTHLFFIRKKPLIEIKIPSVLNK